MKLTKTIKRTLKKEMKRHINWGFSTPIKIFDYGHYNSKDVDFDKFGNLVDKGISFATPDSTAIPSDESFSKSKSTNIQFGLSDGGNNKATLKFGKNTSFIYEGFKMQEIAPSDFEKVIGQLVEKWKADEDFWRNDYVLIYSTRIAEGFTLLVSEGKNVKLELESSVQIDTTKFNIGNPSLNLQASGNLDKTYRAIGKSGTIFFEMYRIGKDKKGYYYKEYGRGRGKRKKRI